MLGDPGEIEDLAAKVRDRAVEVRDVAAAHLRQAQQANWVSSSASAFMLTVVDDRRQADAAADSLDVAADALVKHAQEVREAQAVLAALARAAEEAVTNATRQAATEVVDLASDVVDVVTETGEAVIDTGLDLLGLDRD